MNLFASSPQGSTRQAFVLIFLSLFLLIYLFYSASWADRTFFNRRYLPIFSRWGELFGKPRIEKYWIASLLFLSFLFGQLILSGQDQTELDQTFFLLIRPLLLWGVGLCILTVIEILTRSDRFSGDGKRIWTRAGTLFLIFLAIGSILQFSGYGFKPDDRVIGNFDLTGYPILGYQVMLAGIPAAAAFIFLRKTGTNREQVKQKKDILIDLGIGLVLYLAALMTWRAFPIQTHMFYDQPRPPNYEFYPNSDSNLYDRTALNLITAGQLQTHTYKVDEYVGRRPLLAVYLAALHKVAGPDYQDISSLQIAVFALQPVLVYLLVKNLHTRPSGLMAGLLIFFREWNGLRLSDTVTGVHSQLLMSEIPTMMMLVLFLLLLTKAARTGRGINPGFVAAGGVLGLAMLIRQEVGIIFPFISLGIFFTNERRFNQALGKIAVLLAGMVLAVTPWMARNWIVSGKVYLDLPNNKIVEIFETIGLDQEWWKINRDADQGQTGWLEDALDPGLFPGENIQYPSRYKISAIIPGPRLEGEDDGSDPNRFDLIANHISNQLVQSIVYLPSYPLVLDIDYLSKIMIGKVDRYYDGIVYSPNKFVKVLPYWWSSWSGNVAVKSLLPVAVNLFLITFGIAAASFKDKKTAYLPLLSFVGYIIIYALEKASGGRFLQEMDWVSLIYFAIGLSAIVRRVLFSQGEVNGGREDHQQLKGARQPDQGSGIRYGLVFAGFLILGSLPVVVESATKTSYPQATLITRSESILEENQSALTGEDQNLLGDFIAQGGTVVIGKAYYPRYFDIGENLTDNRPIVLGKLPQRYTYQRIEFYLIGSDTTMVVLPRSGIPPLLPHESEVLAVGCQQNGVLDALVVVLLADEGSIENIYWRDILGEGEYQCPLPWPGDEMGAVGLGEHAYR